MLEKEIQKGATGQKDKCNSTVSRDLFDRSGVGKKPTVTSRMRTNKSLKKKICLWSAAHLSDKRRLCKTKGNKIHMHQDKWDKKKEQSQRWLRIWMTVSNCVPSWQDQSPYPGKNRGPCTGTADGISTWDGLWNIIQQFLNRWKPIILNWFPHSF